ncbi:MAG: ribosome maturation factor RimP [Lachnospiraceae bacterium]|nr:ribosome maturation factor RimP [Lachnospiraceae bacterium]
MASVREYEERTEKLVTPILEQYGFELVDVEYVKEAGNWYLRAYIDKPGGITIGDCETVSRALSDLLDEADFLKDAYILEVSSPGLTRPLKKPKDYDRNIGKPIEIRLFRAVNGVKEMTATLVSYTAKDVTVETGDGEITVEKSNISLIRQAFVDEEETEE